MSLPRLQGNRSDLLVGDKTMKKTLFIGAATNPALVKEIFDAIDTAASSVGVILSDDPREFIQLAARNAVFRSTLQSHLSRIAARHELAFEPEGAESERRAFEAILQSVLRSHQNNVTQVPIDRPIALFFVAAAWVFVPSVLTAVTDQLLVIDKAVNRR